MMESYLQGQQEQEHDPVGSEPAWPFAIPSTLHDSLLARLDRLAQGKEVAQVGAVIGREFAYDLLATVMQLPDDQLRHGLDELVQSGLVLRRGPPSQQLFTFKHALVQDTACATLLKSRRQRLHRLIADALEQHFPDRREVEPELLAHHFQEAGVPGKATGYWERAGHKAVQRASNVEAINHFRRALATLYALLWTRERDSKEVDLLTALGIPLIAVHGYAAPEVLDAYDKARTLCEQFGDPARLFPVLWGLWTAHRGRLDMRRAREIAQRLNDSAQQLNDDSRLLAAHHAQWTTLTYLGDLQGTRRHTAMGKLIYRPAEHFAHTFVYGGHDPGVCGRATEAISLWIQGFPDQALNEAEEALSLARTLDHAPSIVHALEYVSLVRHFRREPVALRQFLDEKTRLARDFQLPGYIASSTLLESQMADDPRPLLPEMRQALGSRLMLVSGMALPFFQALFAETYLRLREWDEARTLVDQALADVEQTDLRQWEPELHRLMAEIALAESDDGRDIAEAHLRQALELARKQQARSLELRAALPLARLLSAQGKKGDARDLLSPVYSWFSEGFDTQDLKDARNVYVNAQNGLS